MRCRGAASVDFPCVAVKKTPREKVFLCSRVRAPTEQNSMKLSKISIYLKNSTDEIEILEANDSVKLH